jgi:hypothetical protein
VLERLRPFCSERNVVEVVDEVLLEVSAQARGRFAQLLFVACRERNTWPPVGGVCTRDGSTTCSTRWVGIGAARAERS